MTEWKEPEPLKYGDDNQGENTRFISPSGQVIGISDQKGNEFLQLVHRTGSKVEMHPNGDVIIKSLKDNFQITMGDNKIEITGNQDVTIKGAASLLVEGHYETRIKGNMLNVVEGNMETTVHGNHNIAVMGNQETAVGGNKTIKVLGALEQSSDGNSLYAGSSGLGLTSVSKVSVLGAAVKIIGPSGIDLNP